MAEQIKQMQRQDVVAKEQWYAYCEAYGNNIRDPNKHDITFINSFITQYNAGARLEWKEGKELIQYIKTGKRKSQAFKAIWELYANQKLVDGMPKHDPAQHSADFLEGFFGFIGDLAIGSPTAALAAAGQANALAGLAGLGSGPPPGMPPLPPLPTSSGGPPKRQKLGAENQLVQRIKSYQRMGQAQKDAWHTYADTIGGGNRDPARHDEASLETFCTQYGVP